MHHQDSFTVYGSSTFPVFSELDAVVVFRVNPLWDACIEVHSTAFTASRYTND